MRNFILILIITALCLSGCSSNNPDITDIRWAPRMEDIFSNPRDIKLIIFLRDGGITPDGTLEPVSDWEEIGRIDNPEKIKRIEDAIRTAHCCLCEDDCVNLWPTWMGVVNKNNQGALINLGWHDSTKRVEWRTHYSNELYDILVNYNIIRTPDK